jgi:hypothetical protein
MLKLYNMKVNLEGNYTSTYGFVGRNNLEKYAEMTFGKNWEAEFDVEQIQLLCDYIEHGRYHVYCIESRDEDDIVVRETDRWEDFIRLARDLECARIENGRLQDLSNAQHSKEISIDLLKEELERRGFYTGNLWHVQDIKGMFKCDDDEAQDVLDSALTNEATMDRIWFAIRFHADEYGLKELEY